MISSKRHAIALVGAAILVLGLVLVKSRQSHAPTFMAAQPSGLPPGTNHVTYDFLSPLPFAGGKMTVTAASQGGGTFLYDLEARKFVGRFDNGWPLFQDGIHSRVLCQQQGGPFPSLTEMFRSTIRRWFTPGVQGVGFLTEPQTCWLIDLQQNSAVKLGVLPQYPTMTYLPSPDLRYGVTGIVGGLTNAFYCFDLQEPSLKPLPGIGWPCGWWSTNTLVTFEPSSDFMAFEVPSRRSLPLLKREVIEEFFQHSNLSADPAKARIFTSWNGREYDFYLTDTNEKWKANESYLIKLERPGGTMRLVAPRFKFEWSDSIDATGRYYLYSGREAGDRSDGVFLRDLRDGTTRTLVEPTQEKYFSIPRFYGDSVIYVHSSAIWRIQLDGARQERLCGTGDGVAPNAQP